MPTTATLDGSAVFGQACTISMQPHANAQQVNSFFGVEGLQSLYGGSRGRVFMVQGVFVAASQPLTITAETFLLSFADGFAHTLIDNFGFPWQNIVFHKEYQRTGIPRPGSWNGGFVWTLPYRAVLQGLN